ncbi:MAG: ScyD/ScyE family protein [Vicinamibacteria bacterium]|nr:ScyD/ScyE family protein [Vicinamibacteria bacterium]
MPRFPLFFAAAAVAWSVTSATAQPATSTVATGLNDPRGLAFAPDGDLYIAEALTAPGILTTHDCYQSVIGPFTAGFTSRIVRVAKGGTATVVHAEGFASSTAAVGDNFGVSDLEFVGTHLLALSGGGGCSKGHPEAVNEVLAVNDDGSRTRQADLSAWILANPGQKGLEQFESPDYEPDGTWYSLTFDHGRLLALEPNHGLLVEVRRPNGTVTLVKDLYLAFGDNTYTSLAVDRGDLYIGTYGRFDNAFSGGVYRLAKSGAATQVAGGLTSVLGIAFDRQHRLYALQAPIFDGGGAGLGSLVRINADGSRTAILEDLASPGSLTLGPDGALYFPQCSFHCAPGSGWVTRLRIDD